MPAEIILNNLCQLILSKLSAYGFSFAQISLFVVMFLFWYLAFRPVSKSVGEIKNNFSELHNATREMQFHIENKRGKFLPLHKLDKLSWATANSPFVLNEKGKNLAQASGIEDIVSREIEQLLATVETHKPASGYDVERCSFAVLGEFIQNNSDSDKKIKSFIFNNPVFDGKEIGIEEIFFVGSLQLRDKYLEKHPEIKDDENPPASNKGL